MTEIIIWRQLILKHFFLHMRKSFLNSTYMKKKKKNKRKRDSEFKAGKHNFYMLYG